jgi:hypothetical protein
MEDNFTDLRPNHCTHNTNLAASQVACLTQGIFVVGV